MGTCSEEKTSIQDDYLDDIKLPSYHGIPFKNTSPPPLTNYFLCIEHKTTSYKRRSTASTHPCNQYLGGAERRPSSSTPRQVQRTGRIAMTVDECASIDWCPPTPCHHTSIFVNNAACSSRLDGVRCDGNGWLTPSEWRSTTTSSGRGSLRCDKKRKKNRNRKTKKQN